MNFSDQVARKIPKLILQDKSLNRGRGFLEAGKSVNLFGLSDSAKLWYAAALQEESKRPLVLVVPDEARVRVAEEELKEIISAGTEQAELPAVLTFRARELTLYDARAASREEEIYRLATLDSVQRQQFRFLIVSAEALLQKVIKPERLARFTLEFGQGDVVEPEELERKLVLAAYERVGRVERPGQFARRGDIIDIYPAKINDQTDKADPCLRLSFFDIEIDEIKRFNPETQRSSENLNQAWIPPAREWLLLPEERTDLAKKVLAQTKASVLDARRRNLDRDTIAKLERMGNNDAERIANGIFFPARDRWMSLMDDAAFSLMDYLEDSDPLYLMDEYSEVKTVMQQAQAGFYSRLKSLIENAEAPNTAHALQRSPHEVLQELESRGVWLSLGRLPTDANKMPQAERLDVDCWVADRYRGRNDQMAKDLSEHLAVGGSAFMFAGSSDRQEHLVSFLNENNLSAVEISDLRLPKGFILPGAGLFVLGTEDIFGVKKTRTTRRRRSKREVFYQDLVAGSYVVHEDHGIGRYLGTETIRTSDGARDYLHISYADGDLHVAVDQFDLLSPYVHVGEGRAKLSRLGGTEWSRQKARAQDSIKKLATDLLALYAERQARRGHAFAADTIWQEEFEALFPFEETEDQLQALEEIKADMESTRIMDRLICGDVGFGKTELAFRAMFKAVAGGFQAALLAPTTILCKQHYENLRDRLQDFPVTVREMSRFVPAEERRQTISDLKNGVVDIVVGTHRLLSRDVDFKKLGLLVIDEEQRFGVDHKEIIKAKHPTVDVLSLTATPIPRTLHMTLSGIRDISLLEEGPEDRRAVQTTVIEYDEQLVIDAIRRENARRGQVFYLYNRTRSIDRKVAELSEKMPGLRFVAAHGQMDERRLEQTIGDFINGEYDVLVATTIIESGLDMPNVNTLVIEDADRLGLAQLYQIRGRVGRSGRQAYALVTYRPDRVLNEQAQKRLMAIRDFTELGSGFQIALRDLEVRGAGNMLGGEQSGHMENIGYDLYTKMLDQEIEQLTREGPAKKTTETIVELRVDAGLPHMYILQDEERLDLYRRIAAISTVSDYRDVLDEMIDRYGEPPAKAMALLDISFVRAFGERAGFTRIRGRGRDIELVIDTENDVDMELIAALMAAESGRHKLVFNAGKRPNIMIWEAAGDENKAAGILRDLFAQADDKS
ncbi:MAG: transcription-repair coupling factor [Fastidiosipila sp.]|nr:transcription-repair coupling factor [Fastidiosipila sp.]